MSFVKLFVWFVTFHWIILYTDDDYLLIGGTDVCCGCIINIIYWSNVFAEFSFVFSENKEQSFERFVPFNITFLPSFFMASKIISLVKTEAFQYFCTLKPASERKLSQLYFTNCGEGGDEAPLLKSCLLLKVCFLNINVPLPVRVPLRS